MPGPISTFHAIEDALIAKVKVLLGTKVRAVDSLPGDWDRDMLRRLLRVVPAVYVAFTGGAATRPGATGATFMGQWQLIFITAHASGEAARRRGDARAAGAYELMALTIPHVHNHTVPDEGTLSLIQVQNLYTGEVDKQGVAVYAATFGLPMTLSANLDLTALDPFETFFAQWDIAPLSGEEEWQSWLSGDYTTSLPDATDSVELEQPQP